MSTNEVPLPFIWSPRERSKSEFFDGAEPAYGNFVDGSRWLFGVVPSPSVEGIKVLAEWLRKNSELSVSLLFVTYPTCATRQRDLEEIVKIKDHFQPRLLARILPLHSAVDRSLQALCFSAGEVEQAYMTLGSTEDFGFGPSNQAHTNFVFRPDVSLLDVFRNRFDELWRHSFDCRLPGVVEMPELALAPGSAEAAIAWQAYQESLRSAKLVESAQVKKDECKDAAEAGGSDPSRDSDSQSPTAQIKVPKRDELAQFVSELYAKGMLVTISKFSRIPPLDAPIDPRIFGDRPELRRGSITRKVNMRVSVIDEETLKSIEDCRRSVSVLLPKFSLALAEGARWIPGKARQLFDSELKKIEERGRGFISDLLKDDVETFIREREKKLRSDLEEMYAALGHQGRPPESAMQQVIGDLKDRLRKAVEGKFVPEISYAPISFRVEAKEFSNPWGQAFSLLAELATYPRKAATDPFFGRGLSTPIEEVSKAMDVAGDEIYRIRGVFHSSRCKNELSLITAIKEATIESRTRCELVYRLIQGVGADKIQEALNKARGEPGEEVHLSSAAAGA